MYVVRDENVTPRRSQSHQLANPRLGKPIEMWPRLLQREEHLAAVELFDKDHDARPFQTAWNVRKLLDVRPFFAPQPTPRAFARQLLTVPKQETVDGWLHALPQRAKDADRAHRLTEALYRSLEAADGAPPEPLTYHHTAQRDFEVRYWKMIAELATVRTKVAGPAGKRTSSVAGASSGRASSMGSCPAARACR